LSNIDINIITFTKPDSMSILQHMQCLTLSYGIYVLPDHLSIFIQYFNSDIRRIVNNLQYYLCDKLSTLPLQDPLQEQSTVILTDLLSLLLSDNTQGSYYKDIYSIVGGLYCNEKHLTCMNLSDKLDTKQLYFELYYKENTDNTKDIEYLCDIDSLTENVKLILLLITNF
jgi:hypothetical protein